MLPCPCLARHPRAATQRRFFLAQPLKTVLPTHERVRGTGRPVVERSGTLVAVGTATSDESEAGEPFGAVAEGAIRYVGMEAFELGLRQHALLAEQREQ